MFILLAISKKRGEKTKSTNQSILTSVFTSGKNTENVEPTPISLSKKISPFKIELSRFAIDNPKPLPGISFASFDR